MYTVSCEQEEWPSEVVEKPGPEIILSVMNINKASFLGSFRVTVSHEVHNTSKYNFCGTCEAILENW